MFDLRVKSRIKCNINYFRFFKSRSSKTQYCKCLNKTQHFLLIYKVWIMHLNMFFMHLHLLEKLTKHEATRLSVQTSTEGPGTCYI